MRLLALNIGNTSLTGGIFSGRRLMSTFRIPQINSRRLASEIRRHAEIGVDGAVLCSVVPGITRFVAGILERCVGVEPQLLSSKASHGLKIGYHRPSELGADRLAAALGAQARYANRNLIVVDFGTATTVTALDATGTLHGGAIIPGLSLWAEALATRTAQLPLVSVKPPAHALGRSPKEAIRSGLFHGHSGAVSNLIEHIADELFGNAPYLVIGTGGNASLFRREKLFTRLEPNLILFGLRAFAARTNEHV